MTVVTPGTTCVAAACDGLWNWLDGNPFAYDASWMPTYFDVEKVAGGTIGGQIKSAQGSWLLRGITTTASGPHVCVISCVP